MRSDHDITSALRRIDAGESGAWESLMELSYEQLQSLASHLMLQERSDHPWEPTDLVQEALLRLVRQDKLRCKNRKHFFGTVIRAMERALVDHARKRAAMKRNVGMETLPLDREDVTFRMPEQAESWTRIEDLFEALRKLEELTAIHGPRKARVVRLRYLVGLTGRDIAKTLDVSPQTVKRDLRFSKAWLAAHLLS